MVNKRPSDNNFIIAFTTFEPDRLLEQNVDAAMDECEHVLLVDDGSAQGNTALQEVSKKNVEFISKDENLGIADSVNIAHRHALSLGAEYLMLFDQDTVVYPGLISRTVASALAYQNDAVRPLGCLGAGVIHGRAYRGVSGGNVIDVAEVIQSGTVFSTAALSAIGGANDELVIDAVDTDICLRLREKGFRVVVDGSISISHPVGSGRAVEIFGHSVLITNHSPTRRYYMTRNRVFILKQLRWWKLNPQWCLVYLRRFLVSSAIAVIFEDDRREKVVAITRGISDGIRHRLGKRNLR